MRRTQLILSLLLLLLVLLHAAPPTAGISLRATSAIASGPVCEVWASDLIKPHFMYITTLQRRGGSTNTLRKHLSNYVRSVISAVQNSTSTLSPLSSTCVWDVAGLQLERETQEKVAYNNVAYDSSNKANVYFLSITSFSDAELNLKNISNKVETAWKKASDILSKATDDTTSNLVAEALPETIDLFFDPLETDVAQEHARFESVSGMIRAPYLISKVSGIVMRMILKGVDSEKAEQILRHCSAYVGTNIRYSRNESSELWVSDMFVPFYEAAERKLTSEVAFDVGFVPEISANVMNEHVKSELSILSSLQGWGTLDHIVFDRTHARNVDIGDLLASGSLQMAIKKDVGLSTTSFTTMMATSVGSTSLSSFSSRPNGCADGYFANDAGCCARMCLNVWLLHASNLNRANCCGLCNSQTCSIYSSQPMWSHFTIFLQPFGLSSLQAVSILL